MKEVITVLNEIKAIKQSLLVIERNSTSIGGWLPKKFVMRYFDYGDTQIRELEKTGMLKVSIIGHRKFYLKESIIELLNQNKSK